jgi:hypothetical protein
VNLRLDGYVGHIHDLCDFQGLLAFFDRISEPLFIQDGSRFTLGRRSILPKQKAEYRPLKESWPLCPEFVSKVRHSGAVSLP